MKSNITCTALCTLLLTLAMTQLNAQQRTAEVVSSQVWKVVLAGGTSIDSTDLINTINGEPTLENGVESMKVYFYEGQLVINYLLRKNNRFTRDNRFNARMKTWMYSVELALWLDGRRIPLRVDQIYGDYGNEVYYDSEGQQLRITGLAERYGLANFKGLLKVEITTSLDLANCDNRPKFSALEIVGYTAAAAGAGYMIWSSTQRHEDATDIYDEYKVQVDATTGQTLYDQYIEKHDKSNQLLIGGIALLAVDVGIMTYRVIVHRNKVKKWQESCQNKSNTIKDDGVGLNDIRIRPYYQFRNEVIQDSHVGLRMSYTF